MNLCSFSLKKSHYSSKLWNVNSQEFSVSPFVKAFQHISAFWNAFQSHFKWVHARYGHFITHSQCQRHTNANNIKPELLTHFEHINSYLFFIYFVDVASRNRVIVGNQIKWNYLKFLFLILYLYTFKKSFWNCFKSIGRERCSAFSTTSSTTSFFIIVKLLR